MLRSSTGRVAVLATALALPTALMCAVGTERDGDAQPTPPATASDASTTTSTPADAGSPGRRGDGSSRDHGAKTSGSATKQDEPIERPTVTAILPGQGSSAEAVRVAILGNGFGEPGSSPVITFGPGGAGGVHTPTDGGKTEGDECTNVKVVSDQLLHCTVPSGLTAAQAQQVIVSVKGPDGKWRSSEPSVATYTPCSDGGTEATFVEASCGTLGCVNQGGPAGKLANEKVQIHLRGDFDMTDAGTPSVTMDLNPGPTPAKCEFIAPLGANELYCTVSQEEYARRPNNHPTFHIKRYPCK